jgi:effector-binding domain-containing protein
LTIETPKIVVTQPQLIACIPVTVARDKIHTVMGPGIEELVQALKAQNVAPIGPWFTHHLRRPTDTFDFEICVPVAVTVMPAGRMKPSQWPAMTAARAIYIGPYEGLAAAWGEFMDWIAANGHIRAPDLWERYELGPESGLDASLWRTELTQLLKVG